MRKIMIWAMQTKIYSWLLLHFIPFIRFTTYYTTMTGHQYHAGHMVLKPGDIILCTDKKKLTTKLIGGTFTHAALCIGKHPDQGFETIEMTHDNCIKRHFFETCKESDRVAIARCSDFGQQYIDEIVIPAALSFFENKIKYDQQFNLGIKDLYCSELVYEADIERRLEVSLDDLAGIGRKYISPDGLSMGKNVTIIWDSEWQ